MNRAVFEMMKKKKNTHQKQHTYDSALNLRLFILCTHAYSCKQNMFK